MPSQNAESNMSDGVLARGAQQHLKLFRASLPLRLKLQEIARGLGPLQDQVCLDIGAATGATSHHLRRLGGKWDTVATDERAAANLREVVPENVYVFEGPALPFKKKSFDAVVIVDALERIAEDDQFIEECHKILKPDGKLVVCVAHAKRWSLLRLLRRMLGLTHEKMGQVRPGYSESELFSILKHGFDLQGVRSYARFFLEITDVFVRFSEGRLQTRPDGGEGRLRLLHAVARPVYWLAYQLDMLLLFTRGHRLVAVAKRRAWRPRVTPVLVDGRSITEAVLSRAID